MFNYYIIIFNLYSLIHEGIDIINTYNFHDCEHKKKEVATIILEYEDELIEELIEKFKYYFLFCYYRYSYDFKTIWNTSYI